MSYDNWIREIEGLLDRRSINWKDSAQPGDQFDSYTFQYEGVLTFISIWEREHAQPLVTVNLTIDTYDLRTTSQITMMISKMMVGNPLPVRPDYIEDGDRCLLCLSAYFLVNDQNPSVLDAVLREGAELVNDIRLNLESDVRLGDA